MVLFLRYGLPRTADDPEGCQMINCFPALPEARLAPTTRINSSIHRAA